MKNYLNHNKELKTMKKLKIVMLVTVLMILSACGGKTIEMNYYKIDGIEYMFPTKYKKVANMCDDKHHYYRLDKNNAIRFQIIDNEENIINEEIGYSHMESVMDLTYTNLGYQKKEFQPYGRVGNPGGRSEYVNPQKKKAGLLSYGLYVHTDRIILISYEYENGINEEYCDEYELILSEIDVPVFEYDKEIKNT